MGDLASYAKEHNIKFFLFNFTDLFGVQRAKLVPAEAAKRMQKAFDRPMIRYRSTQHVIWGATSSKCVNAPIDRFVLTGKIPAKSRTCDYVASTAS